MPAFYVLLDFGMVWYGMVWYGMVWYGMVYVQMILTFVRQQWHWFRKEINNVHGTGSQVWN